MSHTQRMENQTANNKVLTNANALANSEEKTTANTETEQKQPVTAAPESEIVKGVLLSAKEADEFRAFKRRKIVEEIMSGMQKSAAPLTTVTEAAKVCERALRLKQAAVKLSLTKIATVQKRLGKSNVKFDCCIGGNGETSAKVKVYEAKLAIRNKARELTVVIAPSYINASQFEEIRKELRAVRKIAKRGIAIKAMVVGEWPFAVLSRLARLVSEVGLQYFCVPYFSGCERLRFDLINGCKLEVSGVKTLTEFRRMLALGVSRVVTENAWEIYGAWMQEADKMEFAKSAVLIKEKEKTEQSPAQEMPPDLPLSAPEKDKPCVEPKKTTPLPVSKVVKADGIVEKKPVAAGIESSDLKFM